MKLINASVELLPQKPGIQGIYEAIERAARTCYCSHGNTKYDEQGNSTTAKDFVDNIVNVRHHFSVAEHGTIYLKLPFDVYMDMSDDREMIFANTWTKWTLKDSFVYVTGNYRWIVENALYDFLDYLCEPTEYHERRVSFRVKCAISTSRECNRHRANSISEMSTRYCNFSKDKFGNQLTFCLPYWVENIEPGEYTYEHEFPLEWIREHIAEFNWWEKMCLAEKDYMYMIDRCGLKPQDARELLPLSTATEVVYTAFVSDWLKFIELRGASNVHPNAQFIAREIEKLLIDNRYIGDEKL